MPKQKSKRKVIVIIIISLIVVLAGISGGVYLKMSSEQKKMNALETGEFLPGIYAINNGFVNMFLIQCGESYIAVDTGADIEAVKQGLSQLGISSDDVSVVLLTHTHGDHTAGLNLFDKAVICGFKEGESGQTAKDGETIEINGKSIRVIETSGHAADSVCYLIDGEYLFSGDNMSLKDNKVELFNSFYNKSDEQQREDIAKLAGITGIRYVITAHYGFAENPMFP